MVCAKKGLRAKLIPARFCFSLRSIIHKTGLCSRSCELGVMHINGAVHEVSADRVFGRVSGSSRSEFDG